MCRNLTISVQEKVGMKYFCKCKLFSLVVFACNIYCIVGFMGRGLSNYNKLDQFPEPLPPVKYARTPGFRPDPSENRLNAWYEQIIKLRIKPFLKRVTEIKSL